jgi:hypothetical protein
MRARRSFEQRQQGVLALPQVGRACKHSRLDLAQGGPPIRKSSSDS